MHSETATRAAKPPETPGEYEAELIRRRHPLGSLFVGKLLRSGSCEAAASRLVRHSLWHVGIGLLVFASWFSLIWIVVGQTPLDRPVETAVYAMGLLGLPVVLWLEARRTRSIVTGRPRGEPGVGR